MAAPQVIVVSLPGSGTPLLTDITAALGYPPYGTMSATRSAGSERPGPGEVYPLLAAAYGKERAALLLRREEGQWERLETAFKEAVSALWRVWWTRLGQPVTLASPVDPALEGRLTRVPDSELPRLLPGRGCWYVDSLDIQRADAGFLRHWLVTGQPPVIFHHRDVRDRIISQIRMLSRPADRIGSQPENLVYRDIISALPTMDAKITLALTDPGFPGMAQARRCQWLSRHPAVKVLTHEDLAGPARGGTAEARERAVARLLDAVGHPRPAVVPPTPGGNGDGDDLEVGVWRRYFTAEHERLIDLYHGDLLTDRPPRVVAARPGDSRPAVSGR